jgi:hypothetical protein
VLLAQSTGRLDLLGLKAYNQLSGAVSDLDRLPSEGDASEFRIEWKYQDPNSHLKEKKYIHVPEDVKTREALLDKLALYPGGHRGSFFQVIPSSGKGPHVIREVILGADNSPWVPARRDHKLFGRSLTIDPAEDLSWTGRIVTGGLRLHPVSARLEKQINSSTLKLESGGSWYAMMDPLRDDEVIGFISMGSDPSLSGVGTIAVLDDRKGEWTDERIVQALEGPKDEPAAAPEASIGSQASAVAAPTPAQLRGRLDALNARVHREMAAEIDRLIEASPSSQATAQEISIWYMRRVRELAASMGIDPASVTFPLLNADLGDRGRSALPGIVTNWNGRTLEGGSDGRVMRPGRIYSLRFDFAVQTADGQKMTSELKTNHLAAEKRLEAAASGKRLRIAGTMEPGTAVKSGTEASAKSYRDLLLSQRRRMALAQRASSVYEAALVRTGDPQQADRAVQEFYRSHRITGLSPIAPKEEKRAVPSDGGSFGSDAYFAENLRSGIRGPAPSVIFYRMDGAPSAAVAPDASPEERSIGRYRGLSGDEREQPLQMLKAAYGSSQDPKLRREAIITVKQQLEAQGIFFRISSGFEERGMRIVHTERQSYTRRTPEGPVTRTTAERLKFIRTDHALEGIGTPDLTFKGVSIDAAAIARPADEPLKGLESLTEIPEPPAPPTPPSASAARLAQTPDWTSRPEAQRVQLLDLAVRLISGRSDLDQEEALKMLQALMRPLRAYEPDEDLASAAEQETLLNEWTRILDRVEAGPASSTQVAASVPAASAGFGAELPEWLARMGSEAEWKAVQESRQAESVQAAGMILKAFAGPAAEGLVALPGSSLVRPDGSIDPADKVFLSALQLKSDRFGIMAENDAAAARIRTALDEAGGLDRWASRVRVMPEKPQDLRAAFGLDQGARFSIVAEPRQLSGGDVSDINQVPVLIPGSESPFAPKVGFREAAAVGVSALARASETSAIYQVGPDELYSGLNYQTLIADAKRFNRPVRVMNFPLLLKQILQAIFGSRMAASTAA